jgi:hypothetical protein
MADPVEMLNEYWSDFGTSDYYESDPEEDRVYFGLEVSELEGCCASTNIWGFPEYDSLSDEEVEQMTLDVINIIFHDRDTRCVVAITNNNQPEANVVLDRCGFKHTRWMSKPEHEDDTEIRMWWWESDRSSLCYDRLEKIKKEINERGTKHGYVE